MHNLVEPRYQDDIQRQIGQDLSNRSLIGTIVYVLIWAAIMLPSLSDMTNRGENLALIICTSAVVLVSLLRLICVLYYRDLLKSDLPEAPSFWPLHLGVFMSGGVWGGICYFLMTHPQFEDCSVALFIATAGLCAGGIASLAPSRNAVAIYLVMIVAPLAAALVQSPIPRAESIAWLFIIYVGGLYIISGFHRKEYFSALNSKLKLTEQTERLMQLNTIDSLTGLKNRRYFESQLAYEYKRAIREELPISIILLDLDHFKGINDQYGHLIGDECLKEMARSTACLINRSVDIVARYGGEEFAVILPNTDQANALKVAERIRHKIEQMTIRYGEYSIRFTASLGVATQIPEAGNSELALVQRADKALYRAKNNGRNRIEAAAKEIRASNVTPLVQAV